MPRCRRRQQPEIWTPLQRKAPAAASCTAGCNARCAAPPAAARPLTQPTCSCSNAAAATSLQRSTALDLGQRSPASDPIPRCPWRRPEIGAGSAGEHGCSWLVELCGAITRTSFCDPQSGVPGHEPSGCPAMVPVVRGVGRVQGQPGGAAAAAMLWHRLQQHRLASELRGNSNTASPPTLCYSGAAAAAPTPREEFGWAGLLQPRNAHLPNPPTRGRALPQRRPPHPSPSPQTPGRARGCLGG